MEGSYTGSEKKGRGPGFWMVPKEVMERTDLTLEARVIYGVLYTRMNGDNIAWPGQKYLADQLGIGERSVRRYLTELKEAGLVEVEQQGLTRTNRYFLTGQNGRSRTATPGRSRTATPGRSYSKRTVKENRVSPAADAAEGRTDQDIVDVFDAFKLAELWPIPNYGNKTEREAARKLIARFGLDELVGMIARFAEAAGRDKFLPKGHQPTQFLANLGLIASRMKAGAGKKQGAIQSL